MKNLIYALLLAIVISACTTPEVPPQKFIFDKERTINKSFDDVWSGIISWFGDNNVQIKNIDKSSGIITSEKGMLAGWSESEYCDCGKPKHTVTDYTAKYENITYNFNIIIKKITDTSTKVKINIFYCSDENVYSESPYIIAHLIRSVPCIVDCNSNGFIEGKIFEELQKP